MAVLAGVSVAAAGYALGTGGGAQATQGGLTTTVVKAFALASAAGPTAPSLFVAANGNDANNCTQLAPCKTFQRAYKVATPGAVVEVAGGTYPQQKILTGSKTTGPRVVFQPATGTTVVVNCQTDAQTCWDIGVSHIEIRGLTTQWFTAAGGFRYQGRVDLERGINDVVYDGIDVGGVTVVGSDVHILNSDLGPSVDPLNIRCCDGTNSSFEHNRIHDFFIKNGGHMECLTWDGGTNVRFLGNEFRSCEVFGLFSKPVENTSGLIDGNWFWNPDGAHTNADLQITLGSGASRCDVVYSNNSFSEGTIFDPACPGTTDGGGNTSHGVNVPPPTGTTTTVTTTTAETTTAQTTTQETTTATTTTTDTTPAYHPACEPTCDDQIAALNAHLGAWNTWYAGAPR